MNWFNPLGLALGLLFIQSTAFANGELLPKLIRSFNSLGKSEPVKCPHPQTSSNLPISSPLKLCGKQGLLRPDAFNTLVEALAEVGKKSLERTDPFFGGTSGFPFDGGYDWHSSIHGHWMMLSMARITDNDELRDYIKKRISPEALKSIERDLQNDELHSDGYGLGWLLLLIKELESSGAYDEKLLRDLKNLTVAKLEDERKNLYPDPGDHHNLNFAIFAARLGGVEDKEISKLLQRSEKRKDKSFFEPEEGDFLDPEFLNALVHNGSVSDIKNVNLPEDLSTFNAHAVGRYLSTGWVGLKRVDDADLRLKMCEQMETRINTILTEDSLHNQSEEAQFEYIDHWIPQFIWMFAHLNSP